MAEAFNAYFSSVFTVDDGSDISTLQKDLSFQPSIIQSIEFNVEEVCNELRNLSCNKACGPVLLPAYLLRVGAELIAPSLTHLFQLSLCTGKLPLDWTSANVIPIHKKGDKHLTNNYHPISLTSIVVKIMERIIHRQLVFASVPAFWVLLLTNVYELTRVTIKNLLIFIRSQQDKQTRNYVAISSSLSP